MSLQVLGYIWGFLVLRCHHICLGPRIQPTLPLLLHLWDHCHRYFLCMWLLLVLWMFISLYTTSLSDPSTLFQTTKSSRACLWPHLAIAPCRSSVVLSSLPRPSTMPTLA